MEPKATIAVIITTVMYVLRGVAAVMDMDAASAALDLQLAVVLWMIAAHAIHVTVTAMDAMAHAITAIALINLLLEVGTEEILIKVREAVQTTITAKATTHAMGVDTATITTAKMAVLAAKRIALVLQSAVHALVQVDVRHHQ